MMRRKIVGGGQRVALQHTVLFHGQHERLQVTRGAVDGLKKMILRISDDPMYLPLTRSDGFFQMRPSRVDMVVEMIEKMSEIRWALPQEELLDDRSERVAATAFGAKFQGRTRLQKHLRGSARKVFFCSQFVGAFITLGEGLQKTQPMSG